MDTTTHSFLNRDFPLDKEFEANMEDIEMDDDAREKLLDESNRPEDEGKPKARLADANDDHGLVETRQEDDSTDENDEDKMKW